MQVLDCFIQGICTSEELLICQGELLGKRRGLETNSYGYRGILYLNISYLWQKRHITKTISSSFFFFLEFSTNKSRAHLPTSPLNTLPGQLGLKLKEKLGVKPE